MGCAALAPAASGASPASNDFLVALQSVYAQEPLAVSIDPTGDMVTQKVRYEGLIAAATGCTVPHAEVEQAADGLGMRIPALRIVIRTEYLADHWQTAASQLPAGCDAPLTTPVLTVTRESQQGDFLQRLSAQGGGRLVFCAVVRRVSEWVFLAGVTEFTDFKIKLPAKSVV